MLALARAAAEEAGVSQRVDLRLGDLREPPVDERVPLVICPFRSLLHMETEDEKLRALRAAREPARARRPLRLRRLLAEPRGHRGDGRPLARARAGDLRARRLGRGRAHAHALGPLGRGDDVVRPALALRARVAPAPRRAAGFAVEAVYGWFDRRPHDGDEDMIFVAARDRARVRPRRDLGPRRRSSAARIVVVALVLVALYNRLVRLRNRVDNAWAQIEVQLKRRWDLIPNLVESVKGYAAHERETFEAVTQARTAAQNAQGPAEAAQAEGILEPGAGPALRGRRGVPGAQGDRELPAAPGQLAETENKVAVSRQVYNDTVLTYHNAIQTFPGAVAGRALRVHDPRVLRGRGRGTTGGTEGRVLRARDRTSRPRRLRFLVGALALSSRRARIAGGRARRQLLAAPGRRRRRRPGRTARSG